MATVIIGSPPFTRVRASTSNNATPAVSAIRLTRPVKGALARRPVLPAISACASASAAASSPTSSGASLATITSAMPARQQRVDLRFAQHLALAQAPLWQGHGMGQHRAARVTGGERSELHDLRSVAIICARIETAISAGPAAPMSRPMGPWIRPMVPAPKPASASRSTRAAWVRRDPSAPM